MSHCQCTELQQDSCCEVPGAQQRLRCAAVCALTFIEEFAVWIPLQHLEDILKQGSS